MTGSLERLPYWPAALNKKLAAAYCGLSPETFDKVCPVRPISFTGSVRGERYLRQRLDEWLVSIDPNKQSVPPQMSLAERMYGSLHGGVKFEDFFVDAAPKEGNADVKSRRKRQKDMK